MSRVVALIGSSVSVVLIVAESYFFAPFRGAIGFGAGINCIKLSVYTCIQALDAPL